MSTYDPQRNRPRARPRDDEPAPVDALLGETATVSEATEATHGHGPHGDDHDHHHHHEHDHHHHHDHEPGGGVGRAIVAAASVVGLVAMLRWVRRRRR